MYTHYKQLITAGLAPKEAGSALVMLHGRGSTAGNIISLAKEFTLDDFAIYAPQANNNSWYPYSFMAPVQQNEPALSSALQVIDEVVEQITADGISTKNIYFMGFSQGACLTLEYIARNAKAYGGAVAFTGGLVGEHLELSNYKGNFDGTPILISTGDPDPHVPLSRVNESAEVLQELNANVTVKVFNGRPHTIIRQEIELAKQLVFKV